MWNRWIIRRKIPWNNGTMHVDISPKLSDSADAKAAALLIRSCVHCGMCLPACPTYRLFGNELDSPRGRIYLLKNTLESGVAAPAAQKHFDRCLTCRACEPACPSGVEYGKIADFGRALIAREKPRPFLQKAIRRFIAEFFSRPIFVGIIVRIGWAIRFFLPSSLVRTLPNSPAVSLPFPRHRRRMILLEGCAQSAFAPSINSSLAKILDKIGVSAIVAPAAGCCGALRFHLDLQKEGRNDMRRNVAAWHSLLKSGDAECILMTASGCGASVKEYGAHLAEDSAFAEKAKFVSEKTADAAEFLRREWESLTPHLDLESADKKRVAAHEPCTLQNAAKLPGIVGELLGRSGFEVTPSADSSQCCGSAGAYSLLQPQISKRLRERKLQSLMGGGPQIIATANIGCLLHLRGGTDTPVHHWLELLAEKIRD